MPHVSVKPSVPNPPPPMTPELDANQTRLIRAIFASDAEFQARYVDWADTLDFDRIDRLSQRLLPMLGWRLDDRFAQLPLCGAVRGVLRKSAVTNHSVLRVMRRIGAAFQEAGVKAMVMKGLTLWDPEYLPSIALRPSADIDLLLAPADWQTGLDALQRLGYRLNNHSAAEAADPSTNAINLLGPEGPIVDLHRRLSSLQPDPALTAWFLARSTPWAPAPAGLCKPAPEALLLHLCERARTSRRDPERGRWLADLPWIVRHPDLDWGRLTQAAQRFALVEITQRSARLCAEIGRPWPGPIEPLMALKPGMRERALLRFLGQNGSFASLPLRLWGVWISTAPEDTGTLQRLAHFPRALLRETGSPGWWTLIARGLTRPFRIRAAQREFDAARARQQVESQLRLERLLAERHQLRSRNTSR